MSAEVSSTDTFPPGSANGVPQVAPSVPVLLTKIWFPCCHVAQSWPCVSLSMTSDSVLMVLICDDEPSCVYVSVAAL